jgi:hypothetical protein
LSCARNQTLLDLLRGQGCGRLDDQTPRLGLESESLDPAGTGGLGFTIVIDMPAAVGARAGRDRLLPLPSQLLQPLDHCRQAVAAGHAEILVEPDLPEEGGGVEGADSRLALAGKDVL